MAAATGRRSGNPAVRAAADPEAGDVARAEAEGQQYFDFAGQTYELLPFKPLVFQELAEEGRIAAALRLVVGDDAFEELKDACETVADLREVLDLVARTMGGGSVGESPASRRSSGNVARR